MERDKTFKELNIDNFICVDFDVSKDSKERCIKKHESECSINFSIFHENLLNKFLHSFESGIQKIIFAEFFVNMFVAYELFDRQSQFDAEKENIKKQIESMFQNNVDEVVESFLSGGYLQEDIVNFVNMSGKSRINFYLDNISNVYLQQSINNYISSRLPFGVSIFSNRKLCTYYDQMGNVIQCPHDYLELNKSGQEAISGDNSKQQ